MTDATLERALGPVDALADPVFADVPPIQPPRRHRHTDPATAIRNLPHGELTALDRWFRNWFARTVSAVVMKTWFKVEVVNPERLSSGPAVYCFNHLSWMDPLMLLAAFPKKPQLYMYGPKEEDLRKGRQNAFMWWTAIPVPFSPLKDDLITSIRWVQAVFDTGGALGISGEGSIHIHEGDLLPFQEGVAYLALRAGVPIIPVAITGTSSARFRRKVLIRIGEPIETGDRPTRHAIAHYTARTWHALRAMVEGDRDEPPPGSRIERWFTDWFNDWGPGGREAASELHGPDPASVPIPPLQGD
jgi:1-acyl-sn-glycerol-3-phosphate acyltransferase